MRRIPSFHSLKAFESAARLGSFLLASEELHLTPSAISHQIRGLESYFGRSLFVRLNRQVELNSDGQRLFNQLTAAFDSIESACAELAPVSPSAQRLSLHCAPSFASKWLGPRLPSFMQKHATINLRMTASADPVDFSRQEDIDLAITYGKHSPGHGIVVEPLGEDVIAALASPDLAARWNLADPSRSTPLVLIDSTVNPVRWADWFAFNGLPLPKGAARPSFDRGALVVSAAVQGLGIALESIRFAEAELKSGALVRLGNGSFHDIRRELHFLCYRAAQKNMPKVVAFRQWLLGAIATDGE